MLLSATDLIKQSWQLWKMHWRVFVPYILATFLPYLVLSLFVLIAIIIVAVTTSLAQQNGGILTLISTLIILALVVASLVFSFWSHLALMKAVRDLYLGSVTPKFGENLKLTSRFIGPSIVVAFVTAVLIFVGALLFIIIIPGVVVAIWLAFATQAVVFDNQTSWGALRASKSLVTGRWWEVAWRLAVPVIAFGSVLVVVMLIISYAFPGDQNLVNSYRVNGSVNMFDVITFVVEQVLNNAVLAIAAPLLLIPSIILYKDLKEKPLAASPLDTVQK